MPNFHLTVQDLLTKQFKTKRHGYDPNDVDSFLDIIMKDYTSFDKYMKTHSNGTQTISKLQTQNKQLQDQRNQLQGTIQQKNSVIEDLQNQMNTLKQRVTNKDNSNHTHMIDQTPVHNPTSNKTDTNQYHGKLPDLSNPNDPRTKSVFHRLDRLEEAVKEQDQKKQSRSRLSRH